MINRRTAMKRIGAAAGAAAALPRLLGGCSSEDGGGQEAGITTLVCVCMENRSYDHYLGARKLVEQKPGDGLVAGMANPDMAGTMVEIFRETVGCIADPPHGWDSSHRQFNGGLNDGFVTEYEPRVGAGLASHVMGYFGREELPFTYALADAYTSCDRWFASLMGPTWPNRMYLHTAQSGGMTSNNLPDAGGFGWPTIYPKLDAAGIDWRYYWSNLPFLPLFADVKDPDETKMGRISQFYRAAADGTLPPFVMIDPDFFYNDDHPPTHPIIGQEFLAGIYQALATSPQWNNILLVITYDEHGGFFDHVPPPKAPDDRAAEGFDQLGFRVPALIAGPYVKTGHVSSVQYDHTSVLKHAETMFGLEPLTARDAAANDLTDALDLDRLERREPSPPAMMPAISYDPGSIGPECSGGDFKPARPQSELELAAERGLIPAKYFLR